MDARDPRAAAAGGQQPLRRPGGSHGFNFETPEIFNREVVSFLAEEEHQRIPA